ncbi:MAG: hypothetical protein HY334_08010 [Armatimonadetes bacterium]|nr:hypothetical protein [Armatimonadota bacterium]
MKDLLPPPTAVQGLVVLTGPDACLTVGLLLALQAAIERRPLLVIDGANAFDPYLISDLARRVGLPPPALLKQIRLSRVFTCYQLEALLEERLLRVRERFTPYGLFLSGLLEPLLDEEVHREEAVRVFGRILAALERVIEWPWTVVAACPDQERPPPGREGFLPQIKRRARRVFRVAVEEKGWRISAEEAGGSTWLWQPQVGALVARRWW